MALRTAFTELFGVACPIALAPMGGTAGGALAAAVSNGGGLGLLGAGRGESDWLEREGAVVAEATARPWGVGLLAWAVGSEAVERALALEPSAVLFSFGDPTLLAPPVRESPAKLLVQVVDLDEARRAVDVGADVIVAQGSEAGGHGGTRATLPFVPAVVDLVSPIPVLAAGGIADGRGLAAALSLGAAGALIGTRFQASPEALVGSDVVQALLDGRGADTERSRVLDLARDAGWPSRYTARTLANDFLERWREREDEVATDPDARAEFRRAEETGDLSVLPVWAGEALDLIVDAPPAEELVRALAADAEGVLRGLVG